MALGGILHLWLSRMTPSISKMTKYVCCLIYLILQGLGEPKGWAGKYQNLIETEPDKRGPWGLLLSWLNTASPWNTRWHPYIQPFLTSFDVYSFPTCLPDAALRARWLENWKILVTISTLERITLALRKMNLSQNDEPFPGVEVCLCPLPLLLYHWNLPKSKHMDRGIKWTSEQGMSDVLKVTYLEIHQTRTWIQVLMAT